ncbi:hypothetical protein [Streptomyces sp. KLOTTS4A1]|uniref:hypothetical protein n=1 Tax=Streptomyces sp. KLOTTS4A1 TaxID=3390996 RepID=UPI0039F57692
MSRPRSLSVRMTPTLVDDLEVLQRTGMTASDAVRFAVRRLAEAHRYTAQAEQHTGHRPAVLSIPVRDLYDRPDEDV